MPGLYLPNSELLRGPDFLTPGKKPNVRCALTQKWQNVLRYPSFVIPFTKTHNLFSIASNIVAVSADTTGAMIIQRGGAQCVEQSSSGYFRLSQGGTYADGFGTPKPPFSVFVEFENKVGNGGGYQIFQIGGISDGGVRLERQTTNQDLLLYIESGSGDTIYNTDTDGGISAFISDGDKVRFGATANTSTLYVYAYNHDRGWYNYPI